MLEAELLEMQPGVRMASENQLAATHGVSRVTARSALQELERRHLVRRTRGSGTFVALRIPYPLRSGVAPSWSGLVRDAGHRPSYVVLAVDTQPCPAPIASVLQLRAGQPVVRLERLGFVDDMVAAHQLSWIPEALVPGFREALVSTETDTVSTAAILQQRYRYRPDRLWSRAELLTVPGAIADQLELIGRPLAWQIMSLNRCRANKVPLELSMGWLRADSFQVVLELGNIPDITWPQE